MERDFKVSYEGNDYYVRIDEEGDVVTVSNKNKDPISADDDLDEDDLDEIRDRATEMWQEQRDEEEEEEKSEDA